MPMSNSEGRKRADEAEDVCERIALAIEADLARIKSSPFYPPDLDAAFAYRRCARIARTATK